VRIYPGEDLDDAADRAYTNYVYDLMDDEEAARAEDRQRTAAKRAASGISPELLFLKETA
jgi:hypothetical protein